MITTKPKLWSVLHIFFTWGHQCVICILQPLCPFNCWMSPLLSWNRSCSQKDPNRLQRHSTRLRLNRKT